MRFRFVEEQRGAFPVDRLCRVMNVSHAWLAGVPQPPRQPQAAHGHGRSGAHQGAVAPEPGQLWRPRMTEELKEVGVDVGHRGVSGG